MLNLSDDLKKTKTKLLILSGISLFIALTKALPQKVAILGLDLSKNETMAGWFIFTVTCYFLLSFLIYSFIEVTQYYLPTLIARKTANTTGDTIGLTAEECFLHEYHDDEDSDIGTITGTLKEISIKNEKITYEYKRGFIKFSNAVKLSFELALPIIFGGVSVFYLYCFLMPLSQTI
ncbi:MAG: hypothetical protein Q8N30_11240 [Methylococcales bacterium]|jgi:hypothetical protein|nr:hypothetical protein [Methylococcales bacterium]